MTISINGVEAPEQGIGKLSEGDGYLIVAQNLLQGVEALSGLPSTIHPRSCAILAAHALECALKAFLWHRRKKKEDLKPDEWHNLATLWGMAYREGLSVSQVLPDWCAILSEGHARHYFYRYQMVKVNNEYVVPNIGHYPPLGSMTIALKDIMEKVELAVKKA